MKLPSDASNYIESFIKCFWWTT